MQFLELGFLADGNILAADAGRHEMEKAANENYRLGIVKRILM